MDAQILELQELASGDASVTLLLRKALIVASSLPHPEFKKWVEAELGGYEDIPVPPYRMVAGDLMTKLPYGNRGWMPVRKEDGTTLESLTKCSIGNSITELEHAKHGAFLPMPPDILIALNKHNPAPQEYANHIT